MDDEENGGDATATTSGNDESTPASQEEAEPRANFEIDISDANIDVGRKSSRRAAISSKPSAAPPMSPETPSLSPTSSAKPSPAGTSAKVPRGMCHFCRQSCQYVRICIVTHFVMLASSLSQYILYRHGCCSKVVAHRSLRRACVHVPSDYHFDSCSCSC